MFFAGAPYAGAGLAPGHTEVNKTDSPLWAPWLPASHIVPYDYTPALMPFAARLQNGEDVHPPDLGFWLGRW